MGKRILVIIGMTIAVLLIGIYFSYDYWLERELKYQLSEIINKDPNSLYKYDFKKLNIDLVDGSVDLIGVRIIPRQDAFDTLSSLSNGVRFLLELRMDEIELLGFEIREFIRTKKINVQSLRIVNPSAFYYFHPDKAQKKGGSMLLENVFSDKFKSAELGNLEIINGTVSIDNYNSPDPAFMINNIDIKLTKAELNKETLKAYIPFKYEGIKVKAGGISIDVSEEFSIVSDSVHFNALTKSISIENFQLKPKFNRESFANKYPVQKQWFAITLESLNISQIDLDELVTTGTIKIGRVDLNKPNIALYKDKSKPMPPFKKKPLLATSIASIPVNLKVDTIEIKTGYIAIQETSILTGTNTHISFDSLDAIVTNLTNIDSALELSSILELDASARIYNKADTKLKIEVDLLSKDDAFKVNGSVAWVEVNTFNPVLEPMMGVRATDGTISNMSFQFDAMDTLSVGTLDMEYENIKIEVLNTDTSTAKSKKGFMSFAANTVVKSHNSRDKGTYTQGYIYIDRVLEKDTWPYLWHSIQSGLVSTLVPITNDKEAKQRQKEARQKLKN